MSSPTDEKRVSAGDESPTKIPSGVGEVNDAESAMGINPDDTARVLDHAAERRLCRKFDIRILPVLAVMCE